MRVQKLRPDLSRDCVQPARKRAHHHDLRHRRQSRQPLAGERCAEEMPAVYGLFQALGAILPRTGEMSRFPPEPLLLLQYRQGTERIAAVQRQRMIEDMKDTQLKLP